MDHICVRCARLSLKPRHAPLSVARKFDARTFCTSGVLRDGKDNANRTPKIQGRPRIGAKNVTSTGGSPRVGQDSSSLPSRETSLGPKFRSVQITGSTGPPTSARRPPPQKFGHQGQAGQGSPTVLRRVGQGTGRLQSGKIQGGRFRRDNARGGGAGGGKPLVDRRVGRARGKAREEKENEEDKDLINLDEQADDYIAECVDPPVNPTEPIEHVPGQNMSFEEFRKDWPNTPLSSTGLTESVQQRIEFMAHRLPHGYQTPMQLVERYRKGKLMRFESEEEKETVLKLASEISQQKADELMEKKGTEVQAKDMSFDDVSSRSGERGALTGAYVRGVYPELEKQKFPFLDQIVRNLRNNETYNEAQSEEFMRGIVGTISSLSQQQKRT